MFGEIGPKFRSLLGTVNNWLAPQSITTPSVATTPLTINAPANQSAHVIDVNVGGSNILNVVALPISMNLGILSLNGSSGNVFINSGSGGAFQASGNGPISFYNPILYAIGNTPTQLSGGVNNYSPGVGLFQRWSASTPVNVTGMAAASSGGEFRLVRNAGTNAITLTNQDASSTAANRWLTTTGSNIVLASNQFALAVYDATTAAWCVSLLP